MFDLALLDAMPFVASFTPVSSRDLYGGRTYGTPIPFPCYWLSGTSDGEDSAGQERRSTGKIWLPPSSYWTPVPLALVDVTTSLGLVLPDGTRTTVEKVTIYRDADGIYGYEVEYG